VRGDAGQVNPAGAVLDDDQGVQAPQQHPGSAVDGHMSSPNSGFDLQERVQDW
jgi:hypothetical protein